MVATTSSTTTTTSSSSSSSSSEGIQTLPAVAAAQERWLDVTASADTKQCAYVGMGPGHCLLLFRKSGPLFSAVCKHWFVHCDVALLTLEPTPALPASSRKGAPSTDRTGSVSSSLLVAAEAQASGF